MEFVPSWVADNPSYCEECRSKIELNVRYHSPIGHCKLCILKPNDQCYCDYRYDSILYSCPNCRCKCQRCGRSKVFYFNSRKQRGSGKTREWIDAYNRNNPFTRRVSGMNREFKYRYHPQDLCDECIDTLLGWAWRNLRPHHPYKSKKIFIY